MRGARVLLSVAVVAIALLIAGVAVDAGLVRTRAAERKRSADAVARANVGSDVAADADANVDAGTKMLRCSAKYFSFTKQTFAKGLIQPHFCLLAGQVGQQCFNRRFFSWKPHNNQPQLWAVPENEIKPDMPLIEQDCAEGDQPAKGLKVEPLADVPQAAAQKKLESMWVDLKKNLKFAPRAGGSRVIGIGIMADGTTYFGVSGGVNKNRDTPAPDVARILKNHGVYLFMMKGTIYRTVDREGNHVLDGSEGTWSCAAMQLLLATKGELASYYEVWWETGDKAAPCGQCCAALNPIRELLRADGVLASKIAARDETATGELGVALIKKLFPSH